MDIIINAFEPFHTTKETGHGAELGLWVCHQVVRKHGGDIRIEGRRGCGTRIVVELPRGAVSAAAPTTVAASSAA